MSKPKLSLDDLIALVTGAVNEALKFAGIEQHNGRLLLRRGPVLAFSDSDALCVAILQEVLGSESDNGFFLKYGENPVFRSRFPKLPSRQKFADRRTKLTPLYERICQIFCEMGGEASPLLSNRLPSGSRLPLDAIQTAQAARRAGRDGLQRV
jgi:hypothetical protein